MVEESEVLFLGKFNTSFLPDEFDYPVNVSNRSPPSKVDPPKSALQNLANGNCGSTRDFAS